MKKTIKNIRKKLIIVLLILLIACLIIISVAKNVLTPDSHKENEQQSEQQTDNTLAKTTAKTSMDYSKYIGTYTVKNEEGTKYESQHTLKLKEIEEKSLVLSMRIHLQDTMWK